MNFRSDNEVGAHPTIIEAVSRAFTSGTAFSYGADAWTQRVEQRLRELFAERDVMCPRCGYSLRGVPGPRCPIRCNITLRSGAPGASSFASGKLNV